MKSFVYLVPIWLFTIIFPPTLNTEYSELLQFAALVWLPLIGLIAAQEEFFFGPIFNERMGLLFLTMGTLLTFTASALLSVDRTRSFAYVASAGIGLISCAGLWRLVGNRMYDSLSLYGVIGTVTVACVFIVGPRIQGRLSFSLTSHPNYLGLVAFGPLMCSLLVRNRIVASILVAIDFVVIVATESRGALVAAFLGVLVFFTLKITQGHKGKAAFTIGGSALVSAVLVIVYGEAIEKWISSLLFLNDRYRGLGTGFTGRLDAWQEAFDLFLNNPWFGVGFRMHERYMTILGSAHNGYLSLLAEVGLFGTITVMILTLMTCSWLLRRAVGGEPLAIFGFSFVIGYLFMATFERFFLGMGNPTSVLMWVFLLMPMRVGIRARHIASRRASTKELISVEAR